MSPPSEKVGRDVPCVPQQIAPMVIHLWCTPLPLISVSDRHRDDQYLVCQLDIRQDSEFATGYGYPKSALKREPDTEPDIRNAFIDISRIQTFGKSCTSHNHSFIIFIQKHLFSHLCRDSESGYGVFSV